MSMTKIAMALLDAWGCAAPAGREPLMPVGVYIECVGPAWLLRQRWGLKP